MVNLTNQRTNELARYISANVVDGCFEFDILEFDTIQILKPRDFIDELPTLGLDDQIYTVFDISDNDLWNELLNNYRVELMSYNNELFSLMSNPDWQPDLGIVDNNKEV